VARTIRPTRLIRRLFQRRRRPAHSDKAPEDQRSVIVVRIGEALFSAVRIHVEQFSEDSEEAGFLLCRMARAKPDAILVARQFVPIPDEAKIPSNSSALAWSASFNAEMIARADSTGCSLVLVHSHGNTPRPEPSDDDPSHARRVMTSASRILAGRVHGALVLGEGAVWGDFWFDGQSFASFEQLEIQSVPLRRWPHQAIRQTPVRIRLDRQNRALGHDSDRRLRQTQIAVVGCSGGGSHVCQQAGFAGIGTVVAVDSDIVDDTNRGRLIGSTPADVNATLKVDVMERMLESIDPEIHVVPVPHDFPHPEALLEMKRADLVVACVDSWRGRAMIDAFCRRYALPLIDVGIEIETRDGVLRRAHGHVTVVTPDSACNRCFLVTDARLEREREERPAGYDRNPEAGDPQVVSMNGTLASEAVSAVLDLVTGYSGSKRCPGWWVYNGRTGSMERFDLPAPRPGCPNCAESGQADPVK
jgi:molybdopterin/thiamine biosynthesis adenylyltransferase